MNNIIKVTYHIKKDRLHHSKNALHIKNARFQEIPNINDATNWMKEGYEKKSSNNSIIFCKSKDYYNQANRNRHSKSNFSFSNLPSTKSFIFNSSIYEKRYFCSTMNPSIQNSPKREGTCNRYININLNDSFDPFNNSTNQDLSFNNFISSHSHTHSKLLERTFKINPLKITNIDFPYFSKKRFLKPAYSKGIPFLIIRNLKKYQKMDSVSNKKASSNFKTGKIDSCNMKISSYIIQNLKSHSKNNKLIVIKKR